MDQFNWKEVISIVAVIMGACWTFWRYLEARFDKFDTRFDKFDTRFDKVMEEFKEVRRDINGLDKRLTRIETFHEADNFIKLVLQGHPEQQARSMQEKIKPKEG